MNFLDRILYPGIENMSDKGIPERALIADLEKLPPEQQCYFRVYEYAALQLKAYRGMEMVTIPLHPGLTIVRKSRTQVPWNESA
jgi:hypothetical protein